MKKTLLALTCTISICATYAQSSSGLIAHWTFNGNCLDMSGRGHNGTAHNITPASGKNGIPNNAYYFNGATDPAYATYITVPYQADLNLKTYSICATIKVSGFYTGLCQANTILTRGKPGSSGCYTLLFFDQAFDNSNCNYVDTTKDVFAGWAGSNPINPVSNWQYSSTIMENQWYSVVFTFDGANYKVYVNSVLENTATVTSFNPIDSTTDSISIGLNLFEATAGYPYSFKGTIDDIMLYNRPLTTSEITSYTSLAVDEVATQHTAMNVFPNPVNDVLNIALDRQLKNASLKVYNQLGQEVKITTINGTSTRIPTGDLATGMYYIQIFDGDSFITNRFIKQ